jgi:hypothetical protein
MPRSTCLLRHLHGLSFLSSSSFRCSEALGLHNCCHKRTRSTDVKEDRPSIDGSPDCAKMDQHRREARAGHPLRGSAIDGGWINAPGLSPNLNPTPARRIAGSSLWSRMAGMVSYGSDRHSGRRHDSSKSRPPCFANRSDAATRRYVIADDTTTKVVENPGLPSESTVVTCVSAPVKLAHG